MNIFHKARKLLISVFALGVLLFIFQTAPVARADLAPHPRILMDSAAIADMQSRIGSSDWNTLKAHADAMATGVVHPVVSPIWRYAPPGSFYCAASDICYGYQGSASDNGYWEAAWDLGITYQTVKNSDPTAAAAYAAQAKQIIDVIADNPAHITVNSGTESGQERWAYDMTYQLGTAWTNNVVVDGTTTLYATSLPLRGFVPNGTIKAGDGFFIANDIFLVASDTTADSNGRATVQLGHVHPYSAINSSSYTNVYADGTAVHTEIVVQSYYNGLATGDSITISGAQGLTAANGIFTITRLGSHHFYLNGTAGLGTATYTNLSYDVAYNQGYGNRFYGEALSLLYDSFSDYFTQTEKDAVHNALHRWLYTAQTITGYSIGHPAGNYFAGIAAAKLFAALALKGDYAEADTWYNDWYNNWWIANDSSHGCPQTTECGFPYYFQTYLNGVGHPDGANYGWLALENTLMMAEALKTSGLVPNPNFTWPNGAAQWYLYATWPNQTTSIGRFKIFGSADPSQISGTSMMSLGWYLNRNNLSFAPYFQSYLNTLVPALAGKEASPCTGLRFLYWNPAATSSDYTALPTTYFTPSTAASELFTRSGWGTGDVMSDFTAWSYVDSLAGMKENKDSGSLTIQRGGTGFLVDSNREGGLYGSLAWDDTTSQGHTTPPDLNIFTVNSGGRWIQGTYGPGNGTGNYYPCVYNNQSTIDRYSGGIGWQYARANHLEENYFPEGFDSTTGDYCASRAVQNWSRSLVYLAPNIWVVHDLTTINNSSYDQYMGWHFGKTPVAVSAPAGMSRYDVSNGSTFKGSMFVVLPTSASTTLVDTHDLGDVFRVETRPTIQTAANRWLHVFDASTSSGAVTAPTLLSSANLDAVQLGSSVAAFTQNNSPSGMLSYTFLTGGSIKHHILGLTPNTQYNVTKDGAVAGITTDTGGALAFITTGSSPLVSLDTGGALTLTGISVTPSSPSVQVGQTQQFTCTATYSDSSQADCTASSTWTSLSASVATINSSTGLATAITSGTTTIQSVYGGLNASTIFTVNNLPTYTIGGTVSGLSGTVVLQNNGGDNLSLSANGPFTFTTGLSSGSDYLVTVLTQPAGQVCAVANDSGSIASVSPTNVTSVSVSCVNAGDITPPSVTLTSPLSGATVFDSSVAVVATSTDNVAVLGVKFYYDSTHQIGSEIISTSSPDTYVTTWNTTSLSDGSHSLIAVARDTSDNPATSSAVAINVENPPVISAIASSTSSTTATITWTTNEPANSQVLYGLNSSYGSTTTLDASLVTSHSVLLSALATSTTYHFQIRTKDSSSNLATSTDLTFRTANASDSQAPTVPAGLSATAVSSSEIDLSWTASTDNIGVAGYHVYRSSSVIATTTQISYQDTGLVASTSYTYTVTAFDVASNESSQATSTTATTSAAPSGGGGGGGGGSSGGGGGGSYSSISFNSVSVISTTTTEALISWLTLGNTVDSALDYGTTTAYTQTVTNSVATTTHSLWLTNLLPNILYHFRVRTSSGVSSQDYSFSTGLGEINLSGQTTAANPNPGSGLNLPSSGASGVRLVNNKGTYYLIIDGVRHGITNPGMLTSYGFSFSDAKTATADDLVLPEGNLLTPADGSLVKSKQDPTVYLISGQQRYSFVSAKVFTSLGFKFSSVLLVTNPELQSLPKADNLTDPNAAHLDGVDISDKGVIYWLSGGTRYPYPSLSVYNTWHVKNDFTKVVPANVADRGLPQGDSVTARQLQTEQNTQTAHLPGTDINLNGTIYWIGGDSTLHAYPSLAVYNTWHTKNDFSKVVEANAADLILPVGDPAVSKK